MKNRMLPFGYAYNHGTVVVNGDEAAVLAEIFERYLSGSSLLQIARELNARRVPYAPGIENWNKARLMRMLEDPRYTGNGEFPQLLSKEHAAELKRIKAARNTQSAIDRAQPVYHLCVPILCPNCGSPMGRRSNRECKIPQRWACKNPQCRTWIGITDEALLGGITDLLNGVIAHPERLQATADAYTPSGAVQRLEAEIRQMLERGTFDKAVLRQKILDCAARKYREIEDTVYLTEALKAELEQSGPLSAYSEALTRRCVRAILLQADATVRLTLVNGQTIGKEESR